MAQEHYLALYRKYRPQTFDDVCGRDAIVRTLKNQILSGRIAHSYLFCGTRGTGKTTIAKIFAKAVNCENPQDGNPCGECASCRAIAADADLNVVEMDAASNNSVDDIRTIINEVSYSPTQGKYRVYIIDEVHMLSNAAFNALLKTLEEPPSYAIFILATTEPNRLPLTILSRCQRYDFGRLTIDTIAGRLQDVADREGMKVEKKAIHYIASAADGSMRDGLSLLDQCSAFNYGQDVLTYDRTLEILGAVDTSVFSKMYNCIHESRPSDALAVLEEILMQGRELVQFVTDFIWYLRNLMLLKASESTAKSLDISEDNLRQMLEDARRSELSEIMRDIRIFSELTESIRYSSNRRILTEMGIIRACRSAMDDGAADNEKTSPYDRLNARVREMEQRLIQDEQKIADGVMPDGFSEGAYTETLPASAGTGGTPNSSRAQKEIPLPKAVPEDVQAVVRGWSKYLSQLPDSFTKAALASAQLSLGADGQLLIVFPNSITADHFTADAQRVKNFSIFLSRRIHKEIQIEYKALDKGEKFSDNYVDLRDIVNMDIEIEDPAQEKGGTF